jgi:hypothetical protein
MNKAYNITNFQPRWIRVYDNGGKTCDRYTVVFTRLGHKKGMRGRCFYLGMSSNPFHPQGFGQHGEAPKMIDYPKYSHLGKKIKFSDLPIDCQKCVLNTYKDLWGAQ